MKLWQKNIILIIIVVILALIPLLFVDGEYGGADGEAQDVITEINPSYEPWAESLLEPKSGEIESLLFALQAAIGAGVIGFVLGRVTSKGKKYEEEDPKHPTETE